MEGRASHATGSTMSYGSIQLSHSATGETIGHIRGVVADFGARVANLRDLPAVHSRPAMAESDIVNGEVRGAVVVIQRGAVPLVEKARRAQMAGAAAALIVNTDERPLLAHGHRHSDGSHDLGQDIQIPVLVVSQSAGSMFGHGTAGISVRLEYDVSLQQSTETSAYPSGQRTLQQVPYQPSPRYGSLVQPHVVPVQQHDVPMHAPGTPVQQYPAAVQPHGAYGQQQALSPTINRSHQQPVFSEGVPGGRLCSVVFEKPGPLGIYFVRGGTVVRPRVQVQRLGDNAPRMARESVLPGMQLFYIEHQDVTQYPYDAVIDMLQKASRPLKLVFGWAEERALELTSPPAPESPSVKEQVKAEIERALARSRQELEQTQAEALARIQLEAENRTAAAEAKAAEAERQVQEHLLARQKEQSDHTLALQSERAKLTTEHEEAVAKMQSEADSRVTACEAARAKLIAEHEEAVAKMQSEADSRVAACEAGLTSAQSEFELERQRIEQEHESTVARLQSEADSRVAAVETALASAKQQQNIERQNIDERHQSTVAQIQSEADSRIAIMENQMRELSERSQSEHKLALEESQAATQAALSRHQSEAEAKLKAVEARAAEAEREAQQHRDARHVVDGEMAEMKQQVEVRLQAAVETSRAELEEAHQAMLRVHAKAEAQVSETETVAAAKIEASEHAAAETQRRLDEITLQLADLQAALQEKDGQIADVKEQMRVAVIAEQTKAQAAVQQVEQRLEEQMTTAVEQSRAELDEAMAVVARVQQHAQDWIAEAENSTAAQIQDVHRRAQAEIAHVKQQSEREVALIRERALDGADSAREGDTRLQTELEATRKELQETKLALTSAQKEAAAMIAEKDHQVSLTETYRSEAEMNSAGLVEAAQAEVRELQAEVRGLQAEVREVEANAEAQVRSILEESRKDLEKANSEMMRIKDDAEKCITEAEQVAASKVSAAELIAEREAQERRERSAELDKMRSAVVEVTQNVDVRILEKERLATEAETRCQTALAKADEAAAAHARALAAEAQAKEDAARAHEHARRAQALSAAEMDTLQADLTRVSAEMQELQEQAQIEKTRAQDELRLALAQKDEQIEALQGELSRSVADIETEKRRACDQMATACTALNAGRQRRLTLRVFFGWARQACVGAMINGIMIGSEEGDTSSSQPQRSTSVVAVRAAAEEYAKVFAVKVEVEAKRSREEQLAVSAKQIRTELENQMQSEIAQVVAKSHAELEEMQETLVRVQESIEHRIGTATRTQELAQKHQAISASKAAELERAAHAANADISMLKRQLEKTTQVAAEKLDEESSQREAAEARATAAEKQARRAADKARAAEAVIADERALRLAAEADLAAVKKSRSALESREINRHKKEADMRKAFEEAAWRKAQDEKKAREAAERKLSQVTRPASSPAKRKAPRKAAEQATQLSTPSKTSRDHVATPDRSASSARRTTGTDDSAAVGSRRTTTTEHADAVVGYDSSDQTPWRDDAGVVADGNASVSLSRLLEEFRDCVRSDFTEAVHSHDHKLVPPPAPNPQLVKRKTADLINHTARWVATNGPEFEDKLKSTGGQEFFFLREGARSLPSAYYKNRLRFEQDVLSSQPTGAEMGHDEPLGTAPDESGAMQALGGLMQAQLEREKRGTPANGTRTPDESGRKSRSLFASRRASSGS